jgi:Restriction endonuclease/Topoisomerase DNA binding C4 zinc finger
MPTPLRPDLPRGIPTDALAAVGRRFIEEPDAVLADFSRVNWQEFERLVGAGFIALGYTVAPTQDGADGGADLHVTWGNERWAVQCKHWEVRRVGVSVVRQLFGVMQLTGIPSGFLVSSGDFTQDAWAEAQRCHITLIRGADTLVLVNEAIAAGAVVPQFVQDPAPGFPACPICKEPMVLRTTRKGPAAGSQFWGCPRYPACRGIRQLAHAVAAPTMPTPSQPPAISQAVAPPSYGPQFSPPRTPPTYGPQFVQRPQFLPPATPSPPPAGAAGSPLTRLLRSLFSG